MDFVTSLPVSTNWKGETYDFIFVIIDWLTKMVYYEPVKITINTPGFAKVIVDIVMQYHDLLNLIVSDQELVFTSKFWSLLFYFLGTKQKFSTAF